MVVSALQTKISAFAQAGIRNLENPHARVQIHNLCPSTLNQSNFIHPQNLPLYLDFPVRKKELERRVTSEVGWIFWCCRDWLAWFAVVFIGKIAK